MRPLEGIRVLALEHAVAAPLCTRHLADLGAAVIKVERPGSGDFARDYDGFVNGASSHFVWLNRAKRSVTLDLKHAAGREVLGKLVDNADVVVQNFAPGAAARLGISHEALKDTHPALIVCDISGYGESGPMAQRKAYDLLIQAESGVISVTGTPEEPSRIGISIADIATGMYALTGVLGALLRRAATGRGGNVKVAMLDAMAEWMTWPMLRHAYEGSPPPRVPTAHPSLSVYGRYATSDGSVIFGIQNEREWQKLCSGVLGNPALTTDPRFVDERSRQHNRAALAPIVASCLSSMSTSQVELLMEQHGIALGRMNSPIDAWNHEQLRARDRWREVETEAGSVRAMLPPFDLDQYEAPMSAVPALGQHTDEVLGELDYDADAIAGMRSEGVL